MKKVSSVVHSYCELTEGNIRIIVTESAPRALPLSHFLSIHSFLGASQRLIQVLRSIMTHVLRLLLPLHRSGIVLRTLYPANILLNGTAEAPVIFGNVYDCQRVGRNAIYLPLPDDFADPSNPFLPPEYFHDHPRSFTTAFDVWQFGMTLLYLLTSFLPISYGAELFSHMGEEPRMPKQRPNLNEPKKGPLEHKTFPRVIFFYDWLRGAHVVGVNERCTGETGECFFQTSNPAIPATVLELNNYRLLGFMNPGKGATDETRAFLEIIAGCLQIDPAKRPTVDQLLRTAPFNQSAQSDENVIDQYTRKPHPNIFAAQFFVPILRELNEANFPFAMGMLSALLFKDQRLEDDQRYAFPLDSRANEKVISALFQMKFMDLIVRFVVKRLATTIQKSDVYPIVKFQDRLTDILMQFFSRFITSIEQGSGPLAAFVDEIVMSLYAFYAANPYLRHDSFLLAKSPAEMADLATCEVSHVYLYTYARAKSLVSHTLDTCVLIRRDLRRSPEHNEAYLDQFVSFSDSVNSFAHALCGTVEKQRVNLLKTMMGLWQNGSYIHVVRLFIDFGVPQKIIHCYALEGTRNDAASFVCSAFRVVNSKIYDPTMKILQACVSVPVIFLHCSAGIRKSVLGDDSEKLPGIELSRAIFFGDSARSVSALIMSDVLNSLAELSRDTAFRSLLVDATEYGSDQLFQVIGSCQSLQQILRASQLATLPRIEYRILNNQLNLEDATMFGRRLSSAVYVGSDDALKVAPDFFSRCMQLLIKEIDSFVTSKGRGESKAGTTNEIPTAVSEIADVLLTLFRSLCHIWAALPAATPPKAAFEILLGLKRILLQDLPTNHVCLSVHGLTWRMILYYVQAVGQLQYLSDLDDIWCRVLRREFLYLTAIVEKDSSRYQVMMRYPEDRELRQRVFRAIVASPMGKMLVNFILFIVSEMLYNVAEIKFDVPAEMAARCRFPIRFEAVEMICFVLEQREKYGVLAKKFMSELVARNFVESERKMTEMNDNYDLVRSSIRILNVTTQCTLMGGDAMLVRGRDLLHSLLAKFAKPHMDMSKFQPDKSDNSDVTKRRSDVSVRGSPLRQKGGEILSPKIVKRPDPFSPTSAAGSGRKTATAVARRKSFRPR
jgi:serine/threonine protein kinase